MKNHMLGFIVCDVEKGGEKWREKTAGRGDKMGGRNRWEKMGGKNLAGESGGKKMAGGRGGRKTTGGTVG